MNRLGILGGSFDPVHLGHLWIAMFAREQLGLSRVLLIPAAAPPHKTGGTTAPYPFRLDLLRNLQQRMPWLVASDLEADTTQPSYTVETLRRLKEQEGRNAELWLLLGGDSLEDLPHWKQPNEICSLAALGVYGRPGHERKVPLNAQLEWIDGPECGLSSTLIRKRLADRLTIEGMVPTELIRLIEEAPWYQEDEGNG